MPSPQAPSAAARGVGPSALRQIFSDRGVRLAAGLAIAVAIPVAVLFYFQFRSLGALEKASSVVLRQLSEETADRVVQAIIQDLKAGYFNEMQRIMQRDVETMNLAALRPVFEEGLGSHPFIDAFFLWSERAPPAQLPTEDQILAFDRELAFRPARFDGKPIIQQALDLARFRSTVIVPDAMVDGRLNRLCIRIFWDTPARGRVVAFAGFRVDTERFQREHLPRVMADKLRSATGPTGFPPLVAAVVDGKGRVVFCSAPKAGSRFVDERRFAFAFVDPDLLSTLRVRGYQPAVEQWRIRTGYGDRTIDQIVRASTRPQLLLMGFLALITGGGVFFVTRAAAREVKVAELKSSFVSSVSHDLKTPLALIQLFAETLELGRVKTTDRAQEYYRIINSEARKLTRLIENILDFSKIEAGLRRYEMTPVDLGHLTTRVLGSLDSQFRHNQFAVTTRLDTDLPAVMVDPEAVERALENLLSNAMKYSPDHREIAVEVGRDDGYGYIRVVDHGGGIPKRFQRKVFRKFYRVEADRGFGPPGCGLGLAIVDHVMRAHNGTVRVDSEPGHGSAFTLCFPLGEGTPPEKDETDTGDRGRAADVARAS